MSTLELECLGILAIDWWGRTVKTFRQAWHLISPGHLSYQTYSLGGIHFSMDFTFLGGYIYSSVDYKLGEGRIFLTYVDSTFLWGYISPSSEYTAVDSYINSALPGLFLSQVHHNLGVR